MRVLEGWRSVTVEDCCEILDYKRIPVNGEDRERRIGDVPYYGANGLQGYIDDFIFDEPLILIAEDGGRFDEFSTRPIAYRVTGKSWVNNHAHILRAKEGFCQGAVFYSLEHKDIQSFIVGGTRSKLNQSALRAITLCLPNAKPEQIKITEILTTVDRAIEQTEALIAKQQRINTGLVQDLLTCGIDEHGNLRSEQTHRFKDSPLGRIPAEWEVLPIDRVISGIDAGWSPSCEDEPPSEGEWGILKVSAISSGAYEPSESKRLAPTLRPMESIEVFPNDVLISRANGVAELVGRCVLVEQTPKRLMLSDKTLRLNPRSGKITPFILATLVSSSSVRLQLGTLLSGSSGQKNISQKQIRSILLAVPPFAEQRRSEKYIGQSVRQIAGETKRLQKFRLQKNGLMQDLLTGRKRVTPLLEPESKPEGIYASAR